jgi:DNA gyrase inhibitor GyrI
MADDLTRKHLQRTRIRGAPSSIPGAAGLVGTYEIQEAARPTCRALALALGKDFDVPELRAASQKLAQTAARQGLRALEPALCALYGDPMEDPPHAWSWKAVLPFRGPFKADGDVAVEVVHGGAYVQSVTTKGFEDLRNLYTYLLGEYLPRHKQELTRPIIYHRVLDGIEGDDPGKLTLCVYIPIQLSLKPPVKLVTRHELTS